jgi:o-succinylbenzoate synthase
MRITDIQLGIMRVPLMTPFRTALRTVEQVEDIVVRVHTDTGQLGYGEAPPTAAITGDTHATIISAIRDHLAPALMLEEVADIDRLVHLIQGALPGNTSAKAAMEIAIYDLWAQLHQMPLCQMLGGGLAVMTTDVTISVNDLDTMVTDAIRAVAQGYRALKIKLGKDARLDVERVMAIHEAVGGGIALRLDANQGWTAEQTVQVLSTLESAGVQPELVEQPVPARDIDGMCHITARVSTPVVADESVFSPADALEVIRRGAANIINIKLMKAGGISGALRIADMAAEHGMACMIGCMLESSISVAAAAHVAAARPAVITRVDLDGPSLCQYNPVEGGAIFCGPEIALIDAPGLGIRHVRDVEKLGF